MEERLFTRRTDRKVLNAPPRMKKVRLVNKIIKMGVPEHIFNIMRTGRKKVKWIIGKGKKKEKLFTMRTGR